MEIGYNTLDLAMLVIASVVIYAASRVPVNAPVKKKALRPRLRNRNQWLIPANNR